MARCFDNCLHFTATMCDLTSLRNVMESSSSVVFDSTKKLVPPSYSILLKSSSSVVLDSTEWSRSHPTHIKIFIDGFNSIQFDWINEHTTSPWLYKSPRRSRHVVTCTLQSVSCLKTIEVQGCLFHKCNECSLSNTTWHLVLNLPEWV
jgi:hypothetical protein